MKTVIRKTIMLLFILFSINAISQNSTTIEDNDMKFMVEEEKVARDAYEFLANLWNLKVFNNIKHSEQRHINMIQDLLNKNNIDFKVSTKRGVFYNNDLQTLYDDLIKKGSKSIYDALEVGKLVEEKDIKDLEEAIKNSENDEAKQVYSNLLKASQNHLKAFNKQLSK